VGARWLAGRLLLGDRRGRVTAAMSTARRPALGKVIQSWVIQEIYMKVMHLWVIQEITSSLCASGGLDRPPEDARRPGGRLRGSLGGKSFTHGLFEKSFFTYGIFKTSLLTHGILEKSVTS
jgi:hypothetical protein